MAALAREPRGHTGLWERSLLTHTSAGVSFLPASEPAWRQPCPLSQVLPDGQPQTSILIQIFFFPFYYFQTFKAMHVRQSYSYAVTCTWLREESSSLCPHSGDPVPMAAGWDCPSPRHMQMLAHPPWQHSVFFASVDILLTKSKASGFALPNPLWDCSFLGPSEKQIQIISGNVGVGRYRRVTLQCGPLPRRHPHGLPQHESLTCTLNCRVSHLLPCVPESR